MAAKSRISTIGVSSQPPQALCGPSCQCLAEFFRQELVKHHECLERQREYYSDNAITQAEGALALVMKQIDQLSRRDDACELVGNLLKQFDSVTRLSAWTDPDRLH